MAKPSDSFKQFDYSLRPSKQVERKIMIEVLLRLSTAGCDISEYAYLGFGSVYYVDFIMFHKYLFIDTMTCIEWGDVAKRMRFNKPFKFIELKLGSLSKHIPRISRQQKLLVWLDYDRPLDEEMLQDIDGVSSRLGRKSIFVVTTDARPKLPKDLFDLEAKSLAQREAITRDTYNGWFNQYVASPVTRTTVSGTHVAPLFYEAILERIRQTLTRRSEGLQFIQLFNYFYADGAPMLTVGGLIGTDEDRKALGATGILAHEMVRTSAEPLQISVPPLTVREKHWLDQRLDSKLTPAKLRFELDDRLLKNYVKFYKEYPAYMEALL
jgi:hypothetical protein